MFHSKMLNLLPCCTLVMLQTKMKRESSSRGLTTPSPHRTGLALLRHPALHSTGITPLHKYYAVI